MASRPQKAPAESQPSRAKHSITSIGITAVTGHDVRLPFLAAFKSIAVAHECIDHEVVLPRFKQGL